MTHTCAELSQLIFEAWNTKNPERLLTYYADDFVDHTAPEGMPAGPAGVKAQYDMFVAAFPDLRIEIKDLVDTGKKVATRVVITGTHEGELMGIPPTGKKVEIGAMGIHSEKGGVCAESWFMMDNMTMMQQLGVIPA